MLTSTSKHTHTYLQHNDDSTERAANWAVLGKGLLSFTQLSAVRDSLVRCVHCLSVCLLLSVCLCGWLLGYIHMAEAGMALRSLIDTKTGRQVGMCRLTPYRLPAVRTRGGEQQQHHTV